MSDFLLIDEVDDPAEPAPIVRAEPEPEVVESERSLTEGEKLALAEVTQAAYSLIARLDSDPAKLGFPPMLPIELVLRTAPIKTIFEAYGIDRAGAERLANDPMFVKAMQSANEMAKEHGWGFRMKALMQSEELLKTAWTLIHSADTPPVVKKDLILGTWRAAGVQATPDSESKPHFAIQINL